MPANTPIYNFPYPLGTDPVAQGDNDIRALAEDVETVISTNVASITSSIPRKNLLINGAMQIHQRGLFFLFMFGPGYFTADRWYTFYVTGALFDQTIENDGPPDTEFRKSLKMLCQFDEVSPGANARVMIEQRLEGQDVQVIKKGTAGAEQLTLSFWAKTNVIGTYIVELQDDDNNRQVSASYAMTVVDTWEQKTITFPADASGILDNDNNTSLTVRFWLIAGSDFSSGTLNTSWANTVNANVAVGQVNLGSAPNNYWQMTGAMLSVGSQAAPFEYRTYGEELALCQRYYEQSSAAPILLSSTGTEWSPAIDARALTSRLFFKATKRVAPTVAIYNTNSGSVSTVSEYTSGPGTFVTNRPASAYSPTTQSFMVISVAQFAAGRQYNFTWTANAEL